MSQKQRGAHRPAALPEHLIHGGVQSNEERLIGADTGLAAVMARAMMVARSSAPVLLFGETGTGKEVVARAIHERSASRAGPFRRVNCGAIRPSSSTRSCSATSQARLPVPSRGAEGWFEQANDGTLFLDEVGELAPAPRCACCAWCRTARWCASAASGRCSVDVRIVAATHRNLPAMVEARPSAKTSTIVSRCFRSSSRRSATAPATSARSPSTSPSARLTASACGRFRLGRRRSPAGRVSVAWQRARDGCGDGSRGARGTRKDAGCRGSAGSASGEVPGAATRR